MKLDRIVIKVADYRKSFSFYHDIIGFRLKTSWQRTDSWGAIFYCGDIPLEIIWFPEGEENLACSYIPERSKVDIFLAVSNLDSLYQRLNRIPDLKVSEPENMPWGYRIFSLCDPDNIKVVFAQPI